MFVAFISLSHSWKLKQI